MARVGRYSITLRLRGRELPTSMPVRNGSGSRECRSVRSSVGRSNTCAAKRPAGIVRGSHGEAWRNVLPGIAAMREGRQTIPDDLLANAQLIPAAKPLTIFRAELT